MKKNVSISLVSVSLTLTSLAVADDGHGHGGPHGPVPDVEMPSKEKIGYAIGYQTGDNLKQQDIPFDIDSFVKGLKEGSSGAEGSMSKEELHGTLTQLRQALNSRFQKKQEADSKANREAGQAYLEKNGKKKGVVTTESGLQYEVVKQGEGDKPSVADTVTVHYKGTLIDGTEFDSSYGRGQPATFQLNRVIKGWTEGVQLMSPGSKYRFVVPSDLAYGSRGSPPKIGPDSTLIFEVELQSFEKPGAKKPAAKKPATK